MKKKQFNKNIRNWQFNPGCNIINIFNKCPIKKEYKPSANNIIKNRLNYNNINKNIADIDDILANIISKIILLEKARIEEYKILTSFVSIYKVKNSDEGEYKSKIKPRKKNKFPKILDREKLLDIVKYKPMKPSKKKYYLDLLLETTHLV